MLPPPSPGHLTDAVAPQPHSRRSAGARRLRWRLATALIAAATLAIAAAAQRAPSEPESPAAPGTRPPPKSPATQPVHPFRDNVKVEVTDDFLIVHSNGIPDHDTGRFPNAHNPNTIREQNYTFKIPRHPKWSDKITRTPMGPIGVAVNGIPFYNPYNAEGEDAAKVEVFDDCCGHPDPMGRYHYHIYPKCVHTSFKDEPGKHSPLIGYAFDGYAIYGPKGERGKPPTDLDECNGHSDAERGYHYHVTNKFPYLIGGYHGTPEPSNFDRRRPGGPGGRGGPDGPDGPRRRPGPPPRGS